MLTKSKYTVPNFGDHAVVYNGRRYKVVEFLNDSPIENFSNSDCDYLIWAGLYDCHIATIRRTPDGAFNCELNAHVSLEFDYPTNREAVKGLTREMDRYSKACVG
jgi:hypothetical protein